MIKNILVARDFSPSSEQALAYALNVGRRSGAKLHMVAIKVVGKDPFEAPKVSAEPIDKLQEKFIRKNKESLERQEANVDGVEVKHHVDRGSAAAPRLVRFAERKNIDLIVMGTHGRRGVRRAWFGSVAEEVVRTAPCPVFVTRAAENETVFEPTVNRVVAPVDFSYPSRKAMHYAGQIADLYGVPLRLIHAVEEQRMPSVYNLKPSQTSTRETRSRAEEALKEWGDEVKQDGRKISYVVHRGDADETIIESASHREDLVVMATRGLSGMRRAMLGSVAARVIRSVKGPVITGVDFPDVEQYIE